MGKKKKMRIIGVTGGIGMGKSTVSKMLKDVFGYPLWRADDATGKLLAKNGDAVASVADAFPEALENGAINKKILGGIVFDSPPKLDLLEKILHPLIQKDEETFIADARAKKVPVVVVEIPLLFETKAEERYAKKSETSDGSSKGVMITLCVSTNDASLQKARVLKRAGMTNEKLAFILKRQMADAERQSKADYIIPTGGSFDETEAALEKVLRQERLLPPARKSAFDPHAVCRLFKRILPQALK